MRGLVVLACTFAVAGQAQQTREIDNLDDAVDRLALELAYGGKLEGNKVLVSPRYFFERWNERSLRLSAHLAAKFASALGSRDVEVVSGSEEIRCDDPAGEVDHRARVGESASVRGGQEAGDREAARRRRDQRAQGRCAKDRQVRLGSIDEAYLEPDLASHGLNAARKLEKGIRENLSSITGRYRVHIGSFTGVDAMQPERVRRRLVRQLGPAFVHSRKLTRVHSAEKAAGELHGEVYDSGESIELGLYIIDKERKEEVAATNFKISKKLLRDIFPLRGGVAGSGDKNDEALPLPPPPPPGEVTALLERCAAHEKAHRLTMPPGANAADCHAQVLERDPGNAQAQAGLDSIRGRYAKRVLGMIDRGAFDEARGLVEQLADLSPEHPKVWELKEGIAKKLMPEMVRIEGGSFRMGSPVSETGRDGDEHQHEVYVESFSMGKHEVTFAEYGRFAKASGRSRPDDKGWGRGRRPVIHVSWKDATEYAQWLSEETGRRYRLPTEAEWEYAARAGTETAYPWGNSVGNGRANCDGCGSRWDDRQAAPVGSFEANGWGLHDTVGNVREWTCSEYDAGYGGAELRCASGSDGRRVIRGGSVFNGPRGVRSANRFRDDTGSRLYYVGFRLAQN